jgi:ubiquinone biosynthesis protein
MPASAPTDIQIEFSTIIFLRRSFLSTYSFSRNYRHVKRYRQIIAILLKYGFGNFLNQPNLRKYINYGRKLIPGADPDKISSHTKWERMRMVLEELGPNFIKLGQIMSNRPDLLPPELILELGKLHDAAKPFPPNEARRVIEEEMGSPAESIFSEFNDIPDASASVAQVHRAVLFSGEKVAVKIQRPGIAEVINTDIEIMLFISGLLEKFVRGMDVINPSGIVHEYGKAINRELDFSLEASHIEQFSNNFVHDDSVYVPRLFREYSTKKVLTMEYVDGEKFNDFVKNGDEANLKHIAKRTVKVFLKQVFEHGYFHADPHPGNIFILKDNALCFLDYGMMGWLSENHREQVIVMLLGLVNRDSKKIVSALQRMTDSGYIEDRDRLESRINDLLQKYAYMPLGKIEVSNLFNDVINTLMSFRLKIAPDFYLLIKTIVTMKGILSKLDPGYNMDEHLMPILKNFFYQEHNNPQRIVEELYSTATEAIGLLKTAPAGLHDIFEQLRRGKLAVSLDHRGIDSAVRRFERTGNRIALSMIIASLLIGSSLTITALVMTSKINIPDINGINLGFWGLIAAGALGAVLILSMIFRRK